MNNFYYVLPTLIFLCVSTISFGQFDLEYYQLKGTVKEVKSKTYNLVLDKNQENLQKAKSHKKLKNISFNDQGLEIKAIYTTERFPNSPHSREYLYNINRQLFKEITDYDITEMVYDEYGNLIKEIVNSTSEEEEVVFGDEISSSTSNSSSEIYQYINSYDDHNRLIQYSKYGPGEKFNNTFSYMYDENGNQIRKELINTLGNPFATWQYEYNETNQLEKETKKVKENNQEITFYYQNGKIKKEILLSPYGEFIKASIHSYNELGYIIKTEILDNASNITSTITFQYKVDQQKNWIEQKKFIDNVAIEVTERIFTYYN
ncbi:MAG: hypothetical protein MK226_16725 [Saprospiraceae bacterium]|nr:hypothetical protein [Saprospiraceae bacterium]